MAKDIQPVQLSGRNVTEDGSVKTTLTTALDSDFDSINVDKMGKGGVVTAHNAIVATATSTEVDCRGFNALLVECTVSAITAGNWAVEVQGAMVSGGTVGQYIDTLGIATPALTNKHISPSLNANGVYIMVFRGVADYNKVVATRTTDGTLTCKVQPLNL